MEETAMTNAEARIDATATAFCMEHDIPILVFGLSDPENILRAIVGDHLGTIVTPTNGNH